MPKSVIGALRGTPRQDRWMTRHAASAPNKPLNGIFFESDTNALRVLLDEARVNGVIEEENGSTNVVVQFLNPVGIMETFGIPAGNADGVRWVSSSNADEPHFYPVSIAALSSLTCRVCGRQIFSATA